MIDFRRISVTIVVVDSGPLISLAVSGQLRLLDEFARRIKITDVVQAECLRFPDRLGSDILARWFPGLDPERYMVISTPFLEIWKDAVQMETDGDETYPSKGIGDASIAWLIQRLNSTDQHGEVILLLSEDSAFGDAVIRARNPEVYMLSTRLFLKTLENFGRIPSAATILREIAEKGRAIARYSVDRPGRLSPSIKSQWTDVLKDEDKQKP